MCERVCPSDENELPNGSASRLSVYAGKNEDREKGVGGARESFFTENGAGEGDGEGEGDAAKRLGVCDLPID